MSRGLASRRWALHEEAVAILDRCGPDTPRGEVVWAALVLVCNRVDCFTEQPILRSLPKPWATFGGGHRQIDCGREGLTVRPADAGSTPVVPTVTYQEIADLATLDRIGADLHEQIRTAVRLRAERVIGHDPARPKNWDLTPEGMRAIAMRQESERECRRLTVRVWERCRPGAPAEQLDLLELVGAAS